jgi:hypothetical protein
LTILEPTILNFASPILPRTSKFSSEQLKLLSVKHCKLMLLVYDSTVNSKYGTELFTVKHVSCKFRHEPKVLSAYMPLILTLCCGDCAEFDR